LATIAQVAASARAELRSGFAGGTGLTDLVEGARAAGLLVEADMDVDAVPPALKHVVYRALQEALTNALRHAPGAAVVVQLHADGDGLALGVCNGPGVRAGEPGSAIGLEGMRLRVEDAGGRLNWRRGLDGAFELSVRFSGAMVG
jgi:signal transduction histidine kinase